MDQRLGYQRDPKASVQEARKLMAEAGYPNGLKDVDFLVREIATFKLWAVAIQAMLKETLNIETKLRTVQASAWFDEAQAGNFDLGISAIVSTLMDPSDYFNAWYAKDGPQNYSQWHCPAIRWWRCSAWRASPSSRRPIARGSWPISGSPIPCPCSTCAGWATSPPEASASRSSAATAWRS